MYEVTIAIPLYNAEKYIEKTLNSALAQTFESIEFLIIDDMGTDGSMEVVESLKSSSKRGADIRVFKNPKNLGIGASRNIAIKEAKGKYLFFLDSDDIMSSNCIAVLYSSAVDQHADVTIASYKKIYDDGREILTMQLPLMSGHLEDEFAGLCYGVLQHFKISNWNVLFNLDFLRGTHISYKSDLGEDIIFWSDLMPFVKSFSLLPDITYYYVIRAESLSHYNGRDVIPISEINTQLFVRKCMKEKMTTLRGKPYFYDMCLYLSRYFYSSAFFFVANFKKIIPPMQVSDLKDLLTTPLSIKDIMRMRHGKKLMVFYRLVSKLPNWLLVYVLLMSYKFYTVLLPDLKLIVEPNKKNKNSDE